MSFTFNFSIDDFKRVVPTNSEEWYAAMVTALPMYEINTPLRVAGFLAQTCHESLNYTVLQENLNYSATGLSRTFPKRFPTVASAQHLHRNPQRIANTIYANRMGNGPFESGDGWKFRGRGPIQVTGKTNYLKCSMYLFKDTRLVDNPDLLLEDKVDCVRSACWYWEINKLNLLCDKKDIVTMTVRINGGRNGLADRQTKFNKFITIFN